MRDMVQISDVLADQCASLERLASELPPEYFAEVERRDAARRQAEQAKRELEISPARVLRRELTKALAELDDDAAERRRVGCELIAKALARKYGLNMSEINVSEKYVAAIVDTVAEFGSGPVVEAACELLDEPRDPRVRNVFAVLRARLRHLTR